MQDKPPLSKKHRDESKKPPQRTRQRRTIITAFIAPPQDSSFFATKGLVKGSDAMATGSTSQKGKLDTLIDILSAGYMIYLIYYIATFFAAPQRAVIPFIAFSGVLAILRWVKNRGPSPINLIFATFVAGLSIAVGYYFYTEYPSLILERDGAPNSADYIFAALALVLPIFITWISLGSIIPIVITVFIAYGAFGFVFPGILHHPGMSTHRMLSETVLSFTGVFGNLPQLGLKYVAIFILFAALVRAFGGLEYILAILTRVIRGNPLVIPQLAVVSSMLMGSFSGSAGANAAGTGAFTIPLMKKYNVPASKAGAIEAVASIGGQIMPPILGAAAFVMAEFIGTTYWNIVIASILPALLFYGSVGVSVHFISLAHVKSPESGADVAAAQPTGNIRIWDGIPMAAGILAILYALGIARLDAMTAGLYGVAAFLVVQILYTLITSGGKVRLGPDIIQRIVQGIRDSATESAPIVIMLSALGVIVKILVGTGLSTKLAYGAVDLAGGAFLPTVFLVMLVCILFGMAVTTVAAYILTVIVAAPALASFGVPEMSSHFMIFYFAMLSAITPPVAAVIPIIIGISKAGFMETAWESIKLGAALFILPFYFVFTPEILTFTGDGLLAFLFAAIALAAITIGLQMPAPKRSHLVFKAHLLGVGGLVLFAPTLPLTIVSAIAAIALLFFALKQPVRVGGDVPANM